MARKVILDVDPGIDDALALSIALFDEALEVEAVTAVAGNVDAVRATRNVQAIIEQLDPPRLPRIGAASDPDHGLPTDTTHLYGADGLGNTHFEVAELHNVHPAEKVIADVLRQSPGEVTIVALGPLTNIARALKRSPDLPDLVNQLVIMGGSVEAPGNATPAAEFNIYCDPVSAREVLRSPLTKTLVPLDITGQVVMTYDLLDQLPPDVTRVGKFLRRVLPHAYRTHHQLLGFEGIHVHDAVALMTVIEPQLFSTDVMAVDVETRGELTTGATVFDRRMPPVWRRNIDVVTNFDPDAVRSEIIRRLKRASM
ncbi:MAG: nucleoside hydrolase [Pirellulales bacterium]|nr:nucleoside hydrolase [Pirellulales bacterium]